MIAVKTKVVRSGLRRVILLLAPLFGCIHTVAPAPPPPVALPADYSVADAQDRPTAPVGERWWQGFGDAQLNALIEQALRDNFQLAGAWARLAQAEAVAAQAGAGLWPHLSVDASAGRQKNVVRFPNPAGGTLDTAIESELYKASLGASYEVDLWGKLRHQRQAARLDMAATGDQTQALAMTLAATVAETWFALRSVTNELALSQAQLQTNERFAELVGLRFNNGSAAAVDVYQQRQQVEASRAQLALLQGQRQVLLHQLAVLVGQAPGQLALDVAAGALPALPALPPLGVPADLVRERPDVRAAQRRVEAADARVGVALADRFPALRLSGSLGFSAPALLELFSELVWSAVASASQPLFEGGRRAAEVDRSRFVLDERLRDFANTTVTAMMEVENALVQERQQQRYIEHLLAQERLARDALREVSNSYMQGVSDFLRVLTATQSLQRLEQTNISAKRQLLSFRVQLHRALGGTWTQQLTPPAPAAEDRR